eukprot:TRINITY_DN23386_c0_g1_i1.p1 TRINITY_DN23386_c0_g1~~TRINITY_DN23386_c0_g1_i1.p1  ORF type:complete len:124 (-),score=40.75 TRINITY_DN23386_c0_g1_i1:79-411(-)
MEHLKAMHECLMASVTRIEGDSEFIPKEDINGDIVKFLDAAKKLEIYLLTKQAEQLTPQKELEELEKELEQKSILVDKYKREFVGWEEKFKKMKYSQQRFFEEYPTKNNY